MESNIFYLVMTSMAQTSIALKSIRLVPKSKSNGLFSKSIAIQTFLMAATCAGICSSTTAMTKMYH